MGLAPTKTRFTASRLDDFGLDHGPPGRTCTPIARISRKQSSIDVQVGIVESRIRTGICGANENHRSPARCRAR
jgi:hypothetical protein